MRIRGLGLRGTIQNLNTSKNVKSSTAVCCFFVFFNFPTLDLLLLPIADLFSVSTIVFDDGGCQLHTERHQKDQCDNRREEPSCSVRKIKELRIKGLEV